MYRLGVERLLGMTRSNAHLQIRPCIPPDWKGYQINYRFGMSMYHIRIENPDGGSNVEKIQLNGRELPDLKIPLQDDGKTHEVVVAIKKS
jgi:cellobiose phosphorylase